MVVEAAGQDRRVVVSQETVDRFWADGAVVLRGAFSARWVETVRAGIESNLARPSQYHERLAESEGQVGPLGLSPGF
jgi:hypothetical protein